MPGMDFKADFKNDPNPPKEQPVAVKVEMPRPQSVGQPLVEEEEEDEQAGAASTPEDKGKGKEIAHDHGLQVIGVNAATSVAGLRNCKTVELVSMTGRPKKHSWSQVRVPTSWSKLTTICRDRVLSIAQARRMQPS